MQPRVLDSYALIALFEDEPGGAAVESLLIEAAAGRQELLLSIVNWGEIYYSLRRRHGEEVAERIAGEIGRLPLRIVPVDDLSLVRQAAIYKSTRRMSYADCFTAALARQVGAEIVTGDREFEEIEGEIPVLWLSDSA